MGQSLENVKFGPETLHDIRSVTKSIVGLLYGIALAKGRVPALDTPIVAQFPEYADLGRDPERERITIRHALTMTLAMEWNENAPIPILPTARSPWSKRPTAIASSWIARSLPNREEAGFTVAGRLRWLARSLSEDQPEFAGLRERGAV